MKLGLYTKNGRDVVGNRCTLYTYLLLVGVHIDFSHKLITLILTGKFENMQGIRYR